MKKEFKKILQRLEKIEESQSGQLQGGFASISSEVPTNNLVKPNNCFSCHSGNNCLGSNCSSGCSSKKN